MDTNDWFGDFSGSRGGDDGGGGRGKPPPPSSTAGFLTSFSQSDNNLSDKPPPPSSLKRPSVTSRKPPPSRSDYKKPLPPTSLAAQQSELRWSRLMLDYTQATSLHGVRFITEQSTFVLRRIVWFMIVGSALGFFLFYLWSRVAYFLEYNKNVNVEVNYLPKVGFPAVTFCNENPFRITSVAEQGWYHMINKYFYASSASTETRACETGEFQCADDGQCITDNKRCDVYRDCTDGSDESGCDPCPLLLVSAPVSYEDQLPGVLGQYYDIQYDTWNTSTPIYVNSVSAAVYIYSTGSRWILGDSYPASTEYGFVGSDALAPQHINVTNITLALPNGTQEVEGVVFSCAYAYTDLLSSFSADIDPDLSLETMYDVASHQRNQFVQDCVWKGKPCEKSDITRKNTDMGVCYMFNSSDMFIEQSGPGYGLSLTVNIEQYEYTKSTDEGIGVRLLMHDADDEPLMKERGTSVSPGLYSFISVETTQVENLEPPWGTCGSKNLDYYTGNYTIARCTLECEVDYVNEEMGCGCRDIHLPGDRDVCSVQKYINCTQPAIDELRATGNYCSCPTPCNVEAFVPTTSFSIVLSEGGTTQDAKTALLKEHLFKARETTYRVVTAKYVETMRNFHTLQKQLTQMSRFAHASTHQLLTEYSGVKRHAVNTRADCMWLRDHMVSAMDNIQEYIIKHVMDFKEILVTRGVQPIDELIQLLRSARNHVKNMKEKNEDTTSYLEGVGSTVWGLRTGIVESLKLVLNEKRPDLYAQTSSIPTVDAFEVSSTLMTHLDPFIGHSCSWCQTSVGSSSVLQNVKSRVEANLDSTLQNTIEDSRDVMVNIYDPYLIDLWILNNTDEVTYSNRTYFENRLEYSSNRIHRALTLVTQAIDDATEAYNFIQELVNFVWNQKCQTELTKLVREYDTDHTATVNILEEIATFVEDQGGQIDLHRTSYINETMTLAAVAGLIPFDVMTTTIAGKKVRLDSSLIKRSMGVQELRKQIKSLLYVFMTMTQDSDLQSQSSYWQEFGFTSPTVQYPTSTVVNGETIPDDNYETEDNTASAAYWDDTAATINRIVDFLQAQYDSLTDAVATSQTYFTSYVDGNDLNAGFYSNNFLQVELFYKELTERKVSQQVAYRFENLLSELGGLMGLLLGASVLSILEVLDLFIYNSIRKCFRSREVKPSKPDIAWQ